MDRDQQELKSIGFWGILKKTFKIIYTERLIFTKITLSVILPLTIISLGYPYLVAYIVNHTNISPLVALLFAVIIFYVILFLLPTSAVVYTIACIYTAKQFNFKIIFLSVVPKGWIRLMVTFAFLVLIMLAYHFVTSLLLVPLIIWVNVDWFLNSMIIFAVIYLIGLVYINVIWSLASVVSLLEDLKGYGAIRKSKALLKGKRLLASSLFLLIILPVVLGLIPVFLFSPSRYIFWEKNVGYGHICLFLTLGLILPGLILSVLILLSLVVQTILYFVCKSYHHEIIDKSYLEMHLDNFVPATMYFPSVERNVQLEHSNI